MLLLGACSASNAVAETLPSADAFPLSGTYTWTSEIPNYGTQVSANVFSADSTLYSMDGPAYTTRYTIHHESYDAGEQRWVGHTGNSIYYVMFFKDRTPAVTIYKHKCATRDEAYALALPAPDATEDHGWNAYMRQD
ncbi:MAG: hypothetical protein AAF624_13145 [Bacteroidota bacterium]